MPGKDRPTVPKATREEVLKLFDNQCAICDDPHPQMHHIDGDPSNNDPMNLLPLCASCHQTDHHNASHRGHTPEVLRLLRRYRNTSVLEPEFRPLSDALDFLRNAEDADRDSLTSGATRLRDLVESMEMGDYYGDQIWKLISPPPSVGVLNISGRPDPALEAREKKRREEWYENYRAQLVENRDEVERLVVEQVRYQPWS